MIERLRYGAVAFGAVAFLAAMAVGASTASAASGCVDGKLKAIGKKEASLLKCQAKNAAKPDAMKLSECEMKASGKFGLACPAAGVCSGDCTTCENNADSCESMVTSAFGANAVLLKAASKLAKGELKCYTKAAAKSLAVDFTKCMPKAQTKFTGAGGSAGQQSTVETNCVCNQVTADGGGCPPTGMVTAICGGGGGTTTTSTPASTTTTTTIVGTKLKFTTAVGTANCGGAGLSPPPSAPLSGQLYDNTAETTPTSGGALGLGCLNIGGGNSINLPPDKIPDASSWILTVSGSTLSGNAGTGPADCTLGQSGSMSHCLTARCSNMFTTHCNTFADCPSGGTCATGSACTSDTQCDVTTPGSCGPDANCFFGPPLPIPNGGLSTCVLNVIKTDASGTFNEGTGASSISLPLVSRVYLTGNSTSPCPKCTGGTCKGGPNNGGACAPVGTVGTSLSCPPSPTVFLGGLDVDLTPLTTGKADKTDASGMFCASQANAGAFGKTSAQAIVENGSAAPLIGDGMAHNSVLASVFCIPQTGNIAVDTSADLPGPGAIGLNATAQLLP